MDMAGCISWACRCIVTAIQPSQNCWKLSAVRDNLKTVLCKSPYVEECFSQYWRAALGKKVWFSCGYECAFLFSISISQHGARIMKENVKNFFFMYWCIRRTSKSYTWTKRIWGLVIDADPETDTRCAIIVMELALCRSTQMLSEQNFRCMTRHGAFWTGSAQGPWNLQSDDHFGILTHQRVAFFQNHLDKPGERTGQCSCFLTPDPSDRGCLAARRQECWWNVRFPIPSL